MKRDAVDFSIVPEHQQDMHVRLENWALYCHSGNPPAVNPMFRMYRAERDATYNPPQPKRECDFIDGMKVNRLVVNLPERHRIATQWFYIVRDSPNKARKRIGDGSFEDLALLVVESRDMMSFVGA